MLDPTPGLFYKIVKKAFADKAIFATRAINKIQLVDEKSDKVPTLAVGKDGIIWVNKGFWRKYIKSETDAAIVFLHELFHVVTGDTLKLRDMSKSEHQIANISMDMRINSVVCQIVGKHWGFNVNLSANVLSKMYKPNGITGLLRPSSSFPKDSKYRAIYNSLYATGNKVDEEYIESVFKNEESIREALKILLPKKMREQIEIVFIGNHGESESPDGEEPGDKGESQDNTDKESKDATPVFDDEQDTKIAKGSDLEVSEDIQQEISEALKEQLKDLKVAGYGTSIISSLVTVIESNIPVSRKLLQQFACNHKVNQIKSMFEKERRTTNVVPIRPSSRDMAMLACGISPIFWKNIDKFKGKENKNVAIYLDVSGSVTSYLPQLLGIITNLHSGIETVYCFSNIVSEHTVQELHNGNFKTTGGTDFDCIAKHVLENKEINKAIIFTDGYADVYKTDTEALKKQLKDAAVVYFGEQVNKKNFFQTEYEKGFDLDEILK